MPQNAECILKGLNERQREAVTATEGPILVIAGPGSGKTRALTHRIAHLIATGHARRGILAVTFTNKAAEDMRERIRLLLAASGGVPNENGERSSESGPWVGTFHSFAAFVLRQEASAIGYRPAFSIYDEDDAASLLKEVMKELDISTKAYPTSLVASIISGLKTDLVGWDEYEGRDGSEPFSRTVAKVYQNYQQRLELAHAFDFDDLIFHTVRIFRKHPRILARWQDRFRYLHIDEYQDTNTSQYELVRLLAAKQKNVFAIGDDAQSIYSWRRADYRNILAFEKDWPEARVILLEENYRSTPEILEAANTLIERNVDQKRKTLWTKNPSGETPRIVAREHERGEAEFIAEEILVLHRRGRAWQEVAVLYRTNAQSRAVEEALIERDIPYAIIGGTKFFARREIKDIVAYLRYLANPDDAIALKRIINAPARGIGPKTFLAYLEKNTNSLADRERGNIAAFERTVARLRDAMRDETLAGFLRFLIQEIRYEEYLADVSRDSESRIENVRELVSVARKFDALPITEAAVRIGEEVALASEQDDLRGTENRVLLMTIHAAKGLEFPIVFLAGLEEGILPHAKSVNAGRAELEEERRLAYVGMTRAKDRLYLTWALQRTLFGEHQVNMPSRFLRELPPELLTGDSVLDPDDIGIDDIDPDDVSL